MMLQTERLILRELTQEDFEPLSQVISDPENMKHYPAPYDTAGVQRWIDWNLENYEKYNFGLWAVILRETGEFIGDCGITMQDINGEILPEIGYHIRLDQHRKGYASEAAAECMRFGFEQLGFDALYSYMSYTNAASYGVAEKNGMKLIDEFDDPVNVRVKVYAVTRDEWNERRR